MWCRETGRRGKGGRDGGTVKLKVREEFTADTGSSMRGGRVCGGDWLLIRGGSEVLLSMCRVHWAIALLY